MDVNTVELGKGLERVVANLMRCLGYHVEEDRQLNGSQIDLVVSRHDPGIGTTSRIVEVKYRTSGSISKEEVLAFVHVVHSLAGSGHCSGGVFVSNVPFSRFAHSAVRSLPEVRLRTVEELQREVAITVGGVGRVVTEYEGSNVSRHYLDLRLSPYHSSEVAPGQRASKLRGLAEADPSAVVILTSDYGGGKSTTLDRIQYECAKNYIASDDSRVPVLVALRDYEEAGGLESLLVRQLTRVTGSAWDMNALRDALAQSKLFVLLDGFDEITLKADKAKRRHLLSSMAPVMFAPSPCILSTRPSYFVDAKELREHLKSFVRSVEGTSRSTGRQLTNEQRALKSTLRERYRPGGSVIPASVRFVTLQIEPVDSDQVDEYLAFFDSDFVQRGFGGAAGARAYIDSVYDLSDLVSRPILLDMIVETLLSGEISPADEGASIGPSRLYEIYTSLKLEHDNDKAQSRSEILSMMDRADFAENAALVLLANDALALQRSEFVAIAGPIAASKKAPIEEVLTDLRTCSFLTSAGSGTSLRFVHKSFFEFFIARCAANELRHQRVDLLARQLLTAEMLYFLGDFVATEPDLLNATRLMLSKPVVGGRDLPLADRHVLLANLFGLLAHGGLQIASMDLGRCSFGKVTSRRLNIQGSRIGGVTFESLRVPSVVIEDSQVAIKVRSDFAGELDLVQSNVQFDCETQGPLSVSARDSQLSLVVEDRARIDRRSSRVTLDRCATRLSLPAVDVVVEAERSALDASLSSLSDGSFFGDTMADVLVHSAMSSLEQTLSASLIGLERGATLKLCSDRSLTYVRSGGASTLSQLELTRSSADILLVNPFVFVNLENLRPEAVTDTSFLLGGRIRVDRTDMARFERLGLAGFVFNDFESRRDSRLRLSIDEISDGLYVIDGIGSDLHSASVEFKDRADSLFSNRNRGERYKAFLKMEWDLLLGLFDALGVPFPLDLASRLRSVGDPIARHLRSEVDTLLDGKMPERRRRR